MCPSLTPTKPDRCSGTLPELRTMDTVQGPTNKTNFGQCRCPGCAFKVTEFIVECTHYHDVAIYGKITPNSTVSISEMKFTELELLTGNVLTTTC
jgi:hypothetical protein